MATKKQTRANQQNAQKSTGPRTADGKAKASQNALKHGLRAQATVLPDENLDDFEFLVSGLEDQFQPQTALEWTLLRQLADAEWRMRRVPYLEAALLAAKVGRTVRYYKGFPERLPEDDAEADMVLIGEAAESDARNGDTLSKLSRYEARLSHRYFKALDHLQKIQSLRQQAAEPEHHPPAAPGPNGKAPARERGRSCEGPSCEGPSCEGASCEGASCEGASHPPHGLAQQLENQCSSDCTRPAKRAKRTQFRRHGNDACRRGRTLRRVPAIRHSKGISPWRT